jgi:hypothetical protein
MPDREPDRGRAAQRRPFCRSRRRSNVEVWALGEDPFTVTAPGHEQIVVGY